MNTPSQGGSAIFIILIAIALFAALSFAVSNMMRSGNADMISEEQAALAATEILDYASLVKRTVQDLRISNGCEDTEISFERSPFDGSDSDYDNNNSPDDFSCHVFHPDGGALSYTFPTQEYTASAEWMFTGRHAVQGIGTSCADSSCVDMIMMLDSLNHNICLSINEKMSVDEVSGDAPPDTGVGAQGFKGVYAASLTIGNESANLVGIPTACYLDSDDETYHFYSVLVTR